MSQIRSILKSPDGSWAMVQVGSRWVSGIDARRLQDQERNEAPPDAVTGQIVPDSGSRDGIERMDELLRETLGPVPQPKDTIRVHRRR